MIKVGLLLSCLSLNQLNLNPLYVYIIYNYNAPKSFYYECTIYILCIFSKQMFIVTNSLKNILEIKYTLIKHKRKPINLE